MRFLFVIVGLAFFSSALTAQELPLYYGAEFLSGYHDKTLRNDELKKSLFNILSGGHIKAANTTDQIVPNCSGRPNCVVHRAMGYDPARKKLFGMLFLKEIGGVYTVRDVYCQRDYTDADFKDKPSVAPETYPIGGSVLNTEHTWPQSKFTPQFTKDMQKSDLHHLFPTDSEMNNHRASLRFGNVVNIKQEQKCRGNKLGTQADGELVFEVPDSQKGNTARAIFYFATRYKMKISPAEEAALRGWDKLDAVDEEEFRQNNLIEQFQGNRNPFIDFTDLLERIEKF